MKLIELLVQELPKRGGWPDGAYVCFVNSRENDKAYFHAVNGRFVESEPVNTSVVDLKNGEIQYVTREQYEAALAATQQPVWNGDGLPPVGALCQYQDYSDTPWVECKVLAYHNNECWLQRTEDGISFIMGNPCLHPIRSDADKKRDKIAQIITDIFYTLDDDNNYLRGEGVYDAIAAGKVPGVAIK